MDVAHDPARPRPSTKWDPLSRELAALRHAAGDPPYAEVARRITEARRERGADAHAARVAKSTVHDAFGLGRSRINEPLVREIAAALGADDAAVDRWIASCRQPERADRPDADTGADTDGNTEEPETTQPRATLPQVLALLGGCVLVNLVGRVTVDFLELPLYLDMVGTAIAAIALGPWLGALVGGATNLAGIATSGTMSLPFTLVNVAGALVWGYGVRRLGLGRSLPRFLALNLLVAAVCSVVAVPIIVLLYEGAVVQGRDITQTFLDLTDTLLVAVGFSNALTSAADKLISGFVALVVVSTLPLALRTGFRLALVSSPDDEPREGGERGGA